MSQQKRHHSDKPNDHTKHHAKSRTKKTKTQIKHKGRQSRHKTNRTSHASYNKQVKPINHTPKDTPEISFTIDNLLHDGRGVGVYTPKNSEHPQDKHGKKVFISFALPKETVKVKITKAKKSFEEGDAVAVISKPNPQRQTPICQHFGKCGGCSLQHWQANGQIAFKQSVLAEHLEHQAGIVPDHWLPPIIGETLGYRTKARLGVRHLRSRSNNNSSSKNHNSKNHSQPTQTIIGFRERSSNRLTDIYECPILDERVGSQLGDIKTLIHSLDKADAISHLEVAMGEAVYDDCPEVAILIRHLQPLTKNDMHKLSLFFNQRNWQLYLQGDKNPHSIRQVAFEQVAFDEDKRQSQLPPTQPPPQGEELPLSSLGRLYYQLPEFHLTYEFFPTDFTQVNLSVNRQMVSLACQLLDLQQGERVLDLFSGLGNFSLAMARMVAGNNDSADKNCGLVIGVEGSERMTQRAKDNAKRNGLTNTQFYTHDLTQDLSKTAWANTQSANDTSSKTQETNNQEPSKHNSNKQNSNSNQFDALLIDPPRSGAWEIMQYIPNFNAKRIVYVSCNPATLARDSKALVEAGYRMTHAGVMDMFSHTGHVESIARFERVKDKFSDKL